MLSEEKISVYLQLEFGILFVIVLKYMKLPILRHHLNMYLYINLTRHTKNCYYHTRTCTYQIRPVSTEAGPEPTGPKTPKPVPTGLLLEPSITVKPIMGKNWAQETKQFYENEQKETSIRIFFGTKRLSLIGVME